MNRKYSLDPDDAGADQVEGALGEALAPLVPAAPNAQALKARLQARIHASREAGRQFIRVRIDEGEWQRLLPGVRVKRLDGACHAVLLELAPGAALPMHRHHEDEECVVLRGEAQLDDVTVRRGDYHLARAGSRHGTVHSEAGALLFLRGTPIGHPREVARDLLTAWLPGHGEAPQTVRADEAGWRPLAPGVRTRLLREDGHSRSLLLQLAPGAGVTGDDAPPGAECLMLEGEAFLDDWLMRPGDYQRAPRGSPHVAVHSDVGALLFVHTAEGARV